MRWIIGAKKPKPRYPDNGERQYRGWFAWRPMIVEGAAGMKDGAQGWPRHIIWLERVIEERVYYWYLYGGIGWQHRAWMPRNEFTVKLK